MFGFGKSKKQKAADTAYDSIEALCRPYILSGKLPSIMKSDPYVSGFLSVRVGATVGLASMEFGLPQHDAREVLAMVTLRLYGDITVVSEIVSNANSLHKSGDERFLIGWKRGRKVFSYINHQEDITQDPDFSEAMKLAKLIGIEITTDMSVPLAGLEQLWFGSYMEQYL